MPPHKHSELEEKLSQLILESKEHSKSLEHIFTNCIPTLTEKVAHIDGKMIVILVVIGFCFTGIFTTVGLLISHLVK